MRPLRSRRAHQGRLLPAGQRLGHLTFTDSSPAAGRAFTDDGKVHEHRGLKGRTKGRPNIDARSRRPARRVPIPPELVALLREHIARSGAGPGGRLFRSQNGNPVQPSTWWRVWQKAAPRLSPRPGGHPSAAPPLRFAPPRGHLAAHLRGSPGRGGRLGRAQRRGSDTRLRQVHDRTRRRLDHPHESGPPPARPRPPRRARRDPNRPRMRSKGAGPLAAEGRRAGQRG